MSRVSRVFSTLVLVVATAASVDATPPGGRERLRLDRGWRFALGHASDPVRDFGHGTGYFSYLAKTGFGDGPASPLFDDRGWRQVDLPHDWAVEAPFDPKAEPQPRLQGRRARLPRAQRRLVPQDASSSPRATSAGGSGSSSTASTAPPGSS